MTDPTAELVFVPLSSGLRRGLELSVVEARGVVEGGVGRVFDRLGVERSSLLSSRVPVGLSSGEKVLRRVVGVKARQAGSFDAAVEEVAFSVWHRMLFARFLAENGLLMHPDHNVHVTLADCDELARAGWGADRWVVASRFAAEMLPGLFPVDDPLGQLELLPEDLHALEEILDGIPSEVFTSDDGLGWVYQFWQALRKDEVNASEVKIGARELPAVTQLFTEHYMVRFLLENSLGAWWAARHPDSPLNDSFEYLRFDEDGGPAAGSFEGWPESVADVTAMDPCCGSGHFLTSLFEMLWRMRVEEEGLDDVEAQDLVLKENLFGLELDPRCTQIAAFNVALAAWKAGGYRELPGLNIACSGIRVAGSRDSWLELAGDDPRLRDGLERLHEVFKDADTLGSLIDPKRTVADNGLLSVEWDEIRPLLTTALNEEKIDDPGAAVFGQQVAGVAKAATLLSRTYTLVATNPPFLTRSKFGAAFLRYSRGALSGANQDLANLLHVRFGEPRASNAQAVVLPQAWMSLARYRGYRQWLVDGRAISMLARLGEHSFGSSGAAGAFVILALTGGFSSSRRSMSTVDCIEGPTPDSKSACLLNRPLDSVDLDHIATFDDLRFTMKARTIGRPLGEIASSAQGISTSDFPRFGRTFWEMPEVDRGWVRQQSTVTESTLYGGREMILFWEDGYGRITEVCQAGATFRGDEVWGQRGVAVSQMRRLPATLYSGNISDSNATMVVPLDPEDIPAIWSFVRSSKFYEEVRLIDQSIKVTNSTFRSVPFDVDYWRGRAAEEFPDGLPEPWSDDPTQWLFLGDPAESTDPLQVGVGRLLWYSWPDQEPDELDGFADEDGIVCLLSVMGERPAADRLRDLLVAAFDAESDPVRLVDGLLADADASGKGLRWWLENQFFKQHHQLFHKRPFIWHITDGRRDGFSALVNYHMLDRSGLERLTFTYLGWWIDSQRAEVARGVAGADDRLAAAEELQDKLKLILDGEPPYDIYVRWKSLAEQSIGWNPDLDDGVRLNIRPFVEAGVLKIKKPPGIKWGKDRGKNPDGSERFNDLHFTREEKQIARDNA